MSFCAHIEVLEERIVLGNNFRNDNNITVLMVATRRTAQRLHTAFRNLCLQLCSLVYL